MFFEVLCSYHIWSSGHFLQFLLTDSGEKCLLSALLVILQHFQVFYGYTCSVFLAPSCGKIFKFVRLFIDSAMHLARCYQFPFCFSKGGTKIQICGLSLSCRFGSIFLEVLTSYLPKLTIATIESTIKELSTALGYLSKMHGVLIVIVGQLREPASKSSLVLVGRLFDGICDIVGSTFF